MIIIETKIENLMESFLNDDDPISNSFGGSTAN